MSPGFQPALSAPLVRRGEEYTFALGYIGDRLCSLTFRDQGETMYIISLRYANQRELLRMPILRPGTYWPTPSEDEAINSGIADDPDNPEWTEKEFAEARPALEVVPHIVAEFHAKQVRKANRAGP